MAGTSLLMLLDDIATLLDDVAAMTKVATKQTAGILGDDLAVNAEQVTGVDADRELPVVWAVAKGSALNKAILVPAALAISAATPWAITPLLMVGGAFLCFEGVEKVLHKVLHNEAEDEEHHQEMLKALTDESVDMVEFEREKIKGAIRTDFILSAEIVVISLGTVAAATFIEKASVLVAISVIMTVGVYGFVAAIVKLDDVGLHLSKKGGGAAKLGYLMVAGAPYLMRGLGIAGTLAMFLVGGGIIAHGIPGLEHFVHELLPPGGLGTVLGMLFNAVVGILVGLLVVGVVEGTKRLRPTQA